MNQKIKDKIYFWAVCVILTAAIVSCGFCGACAWQGQKHQTFAGDKMTLNAEWWSMRFCWVSSGVELYEWTPFWRAGANIVKSGSEPNSIIAAGQAGGNVAEAVVRGAMVIAGKE